MITFDFFDFSTFLAGLAFAFFSLPALFDLGYHGLDLTRLNLATLCEIDDALRRIADKTYGVCEMTGKPIPVARLNAKPWAKYTIEAARMLEGQWRA